VRIIIVYASKGRSGKIIAQEIKARLSYESNIICLNENEVNSEDLSFDWLILVSPTYGDAELEIGMEKFLTRSSWLVSVNRYFSVCELGLYRGYDQKSMGAGSIIDKFLTDHGLIRRGNILSIDSVPLQNLSLIEKWLNKL
jgi:flavodoxin